MRKLILLTALVISSVPTGAGADSARFVGETRCALPACHGSAIPARQKDAGPRPCGDWTPWRWARTQWLNANIDRHSRAYRTLANSDESKRIAAYMGIASPGDSEKCTVCHAPPASTTRAGELLIDGQPSRHQRSDGVSCEHCHGPAEFWLKPHVEKDWPQKRAEYAGRGFYNNNDLRLRAQKCAACHVAIDHEIIAAGHPPLQFEMVAYAQIMKHWDDCDEYPGAYSIDTTIWGLGQLVGLQRTLEMLADRAGGNNYQSTDNFAHFKEKACYQCHHKLLDDTLRQGQGHYEMSAALLAPVLPDRLDELTRRWRELSDSIASNPAKAKQQADVFAEWLGGLESQLLSKRVDQSAGKQILRTILSRGNDFKRIRQFRYRRAEQSNVVAIDQIGLPWWYTTGAPEQTCLAIAALCDPTLGARCRSADGEVHRLLQSVDRFNYQPDEFAKLLQSISRKLFP